ncbi:hypothetical protein D3C72_2140500 [compost metagenome]
MGQLPHVFLGHLLAVAVAQHRFQYQPDGDRQPFDLHAQRLAQLRQGIVLAAAAGAELEFLESVIEIVGHCLTPIEG